jgi:hypothetical protein
MPNNRLGDNFAKEREGNKAMRPISRIKIRYKKNVLTSPIEVNTSKLMF